MELLDDAEQVVPAPGVEARRVLAQFVQDLVHLERSQDRLDQDGRAYGAARDPERGLGMNEHVVPEVRLVVRFELGEVQVRTTPGRDRGRARMEQVHPEVEQRRRDGHAIDEHV